MKRVSLTLKNVCLLVVCLYCINSSASAFTIGKRNTPLHKNIGSPYCNHGHVICTLRMKKSSSTGGDKLREATGIRPSLHPTTINAISEALQLRSKLLDKSNLIVTPENNIQPIDVAMKAGSIAASAIEKRQLSSEKSNDGMLLTNEEEQTIAGRVVGVIMRFNELEALLNDKVSGVTWVSKYNEWHTFGITKDETQGSIVNNTILHNRINDDPLFSMCRAECLLALFLHTVEKPTLDKQNEVLPNSFQAPDSSTIDFLDDDRYSVLLD